MTEQPKGIPDLATLLYLHREEVAATWAELVHGRLGSQYRELPLEELCASAGQGVEAVVEALSDTGSRTALERYLTDVCMVRLEMGFGIADVIEALLLCKEAILPVIWRGYASDPVAAREPIAQLDACLRWAIGHFGELYATEMSRRLREQQERAVLQARQLAVLEERDRLAREMHDNLSQALGYLNLRASITDERLSSGQIAEAQASLLELKRVARETYMDVREAIFGLRARVVPELGFLITLREYLDEYQTHYGVDVELALEDESLVEFPPDVAIQVTRIVQEALTNVRRHAGTNKARIGIDREGDQVRISVEDDGHGFDLVQTAGGGGDYFGLQIMHERAESVGGSLQIHSLPDQGTRVVLLVPRTLQD